MKHKRLISILSLLYATSNADVCSLTYGGYQSGNHFNGPTQCGSGNIDSISVNGPLTISGTIIKNAGLINGPVNTQNAQITTLTMNGYLRSTSTSFTTINAKGNLEFTTRGSAGSNIGNIVISDSKPIPNNYKVCLNGNTIVNNISFINGNGVIYKNTSAKITGTVSGAKVENYSSAECSL